VSLFSLVSIGQCRNPVRVIRSAGAKKCSLPLAFTQAVGALHFVELFMGWLCSAGSNRPAFLATAMLAMTGFIHGSSRKTLSGLRQDLQPE